MRRRCRAPMIALMAALAFGLGSQSRFALADQAGTADYTLDEHHRYRRPNRSAPLLPAHQTSQHRKWWRLIEPAGGVVTPAATSTQGPLTIMAGSTGLTSSGVFDYLFSTTDQNGKPLQALGLSFFGQGLEAGGVLNFSLNVTNANNPPLLVSQTSGVSIALDATNLDHRLDLFLVLLLILLFTAHDVDPRTVVAVALDDPGRSRLYPQARACAARTGLATAFDDCGRAVSSISSTISL